MNAYVEGLKGRASYQGFATLDEAVDDYLTARSNGFVKIVRDSSDDEHFGPIEDAETLPEFF